MAFKNYCVPIVGHKEMVVPGAGKLSVYIGKHLICCDSVITSYHHPCIAFYYKHTTMFLNTLSSLHL